eukprot:6247785-Prymnesium_polylepis.1
MRRGRGSAQPRRCPRRAPTHRPDPRQKLRGASTPSRGTRSLLRKASTPFGRRRPTGRGRPDRSRPRDTTRR